LLVNTMPLTLHNCCHSNKRGRQYAYIHTYVCFGSCITNNTFKALSLLQRIRFISHFAFLFVFRVSLSFFLHICHNMLSIQRCMLFAIHTHTYVCMYKGSTAYVLHTHSQRYELETLHLYVCVCVCVTLKIWQKSRNVKQAAKYCHVSHPNTPLTSPIVLSRCRPAAFFFQFSWQCVK